MKQKFIFLFGFAICILAKKTVAQDGNLGIGTVNPDKSAILEMKSNDKGLLMPRLTLEQRNSIKNPANGLMIYQIDKSTGFYFFDGLSWKSFSTTGDEKSVAASGVFWDLDGNTNATLASYIGTPVGVPINFKIGGLRAGVIDPSSATENTYFGVEAGRDNIGGPGANGYWNVGIGNRALKVNTIGYNNISIGIESMSKNTNGRNNTSIGYQSMFNNDGGESNFALGGYALFSQVTGSNNTAIGINALYSSNGGSNNIGLGKEVLYYNIAGTGNVAIGSSALASHTGSNNTALGHEAGFKSGYTPVVNASGNLFLGFQAGYNETTSNNLYISNSNSANPLIKGNFNSKLLRINVGPTSGTPGTASTTGYLAIGDFDAGSPMAVPAGYRLVVEQGILTEKIKVALKASAVGGDWADYVFEPEYKAKMMSLEDVEKYTLVNKHLPNVPSTAEMQKEGLDVLKTSKMFMEKIEELTIYLIEMNKEIKALKAENEILKNRK